MSTTRAVGRRLLWESTGGAEYVSLTPTGGGAAGATLLDTRWSGRSNDMFNNWWLTLPLGPAGVTSYEAREVSTFAKSGGTFTPLTAFSAQVTTAATYELHRYNPALFHVALNRAADLAFPDTYFPKRDESLMVDNLLSNWDFETYAASAFTGWSNVGTPTIAQETSRVWHGSSAAKIVASGAEEGLSQDIFGTVNVTEMVGKSLHVEGRVWASVASAARLRVTFDGLTYTNSSWHVGASEWEGPATLSLDATIPSGATQMKVICSVADGQTAYFDAVGAWIDRLRRYTVPTAFAKPPNQVSVQSDREDALEPFYPIAWHPEYSGETRYIILDGVPPSGYILRLEGYAPLSQMTSDTDTVELSSPQRELWIAHAALFLYRALWDVASGQDHEDFEKAMAMWSGQVKYLEGRPGMRTVAQAQQAHRKWYTK